MKKLAWTLFLLLWSLPALAVDKYIANNGNDSNPGTLSQPWLTPKHDGLTCGVDRVIALPGEYGASSVGNSQFSQFGAVNCPGANNVVPLICQTFLGCHWYPNQNYSTAWSLNAPYWAVFGWSFAGNRFGGVLVAGNAVHHVIVANNLCVDTDFCAGSYADNNPGVQDYIVIAGNLSFRSGGYYANGGAGEAARSGCASAFSVAAPKALDHQPGTHIYVAGNFALLTRNQADCDPTGAGATDGEGLIGDTINGNGYTEQIVFANNLLLGNGGRGLQMLQSAARTYFHHNTQWHNNADPAQPNAGCAETESYAATNLEVYAGLDVPRPSGCGDSGNSAHAVGLYNGGATNHAYASWAYAADGSHFATDGTGGFAFGPNNMSGADPQFANPVLPSTAPSCTGFANTVACMESVIAGFTPTNPNAKAYGYQRPRTATVYDPLFPQWLCNVADLPPVITRGCKGVGTVRRGASFVPAATVVTLPPVTPPVAPNDPSVMSTGVNAALNGFVLFPGSDFNTPITTRAVSQYNNAFQATTFANTGLRPDGQDGNGFNYTVVPDGTPEDTPSYGDFDEKLSNGPMVVRDSTVPLVESDDVLWPNPTGCNRTENGFDVRTNAGNGFTGDFHVNCLTRQGKLFAGYQNRLVGSTLRTYNGKVYDVTKPFEGQVALGTTSEDVAALPTAALVINYDEAHSGTIKHAGRFTMQRSSCLYGTHGANVSPSGHNSGCGGSGTPVLPMGARFRWKGTVNGVLLDTTHYSAAARAILTMMQDYGLYMADNGANGFVQVTADARWTYSTDLAPLAQLKLSDFDMVDSGTAFTAETNESNGYTDAVVHTYNVATAQSSLIPNPYGRPSNLQFSCTPMSVAAGGSVTCTGSATNAAKLYTDFAGTLFTGSTTFTPVRSMRLTMFAEGKYGKAAKSLNITVSGVTVADPVPSVPAGSYTATQVVALTTSTSGAVIHVSPGSGTANCSSPVYTGPTSVSAGSLTIAGSKATTLSYVACGPGLIPSNVVNSTFVVTNAVPSLGVVQRAGVAGNNSTGTLTVALPSPPSAGNTLVAAVAYFNAYKLTAPPAGWTLVHHFTGQQGKILDVFKASSVGTGSYSATFDQPPGWSSMAVYEVHGAAAGIVDSYGTAFSNSATASDKTTLSRPSAPATPAVAGELALAFSTPTATITSTTGATISDGWTLDTFGTAIHHTLMAGIRNTLTADTATPVSATFTTPNSPNDDGSNDTPTLAVTVLIRPQ